MMASNCVANRADAALPDVRDARVLVVEDQDRQCRQLLDILGTFGIEPMRAKSGYEAIQFAAEHRPETIFLDGLLPGMHGFEVARFIRHIDAGYRPWIVLLTAIYKNVKYRNEATLKYGIDEYVIKPIAADRVTKILEHAGYFGRPAMARVAS